MADQFEFTGEEIPEDERIADLDIFSEEVESLEDVSSSEGREYDWDDRIEWEGELTGGTWGPEEGTVTVKKKLAGRLTLGREHVRSIGRGTADPDCDYYFIWFEFTLHKAPGNRKYREMSLQVQVDDEGCTAYDLLPKDVYQEIDVERKFVISPSLKFKLANGAKAEVSPGSLERAISFQKLKPLITAYGIGEQQFYWTYEPERGNGVAGGSKPALIVLEVPEGQQQVTGQIFGETRIEKRVLGEWWTANGRTEKYPFTWNLSGSEPLTET